MRQAGKMREESVDKRCVETDTWLLGVATGMGMRQAGKMREESEEEGGGKRQRQGGGTEDKS